VWCGAAAAYIDLLAPSSDGTPGFAGDTEDYEAAGSGGSGNEDVDPEAPPLDLIKAQLMAEDDIGRLSSLGDEGDAGGRPPQAELRAADELRSALHGWEGAGGRVMHCCTPRLTRRARQPATLQLHAMLCSGTRMQLTRAWGATKAARRPPSEERVHLSDLHIQAHSAGAGSEAAGLYRRLVQVL
jgi:hypothetical protein